MVSLPDHLKPVPVGQGKLPREVLEEHQRARVVDAAIAVFAEKGYPASTVDELVAAAKVGVGSFYAHFDGKEGCLLAAYDAIVEEGRSHVREVAAGGGSWAEEVSLAVPALLDWLAANPARGKVALIEIQTGGPIAVARYEATLAEAVKALRAGRKAAKPAHRLPANLEQTTVSGLAWLLHKRLAVGEAESLPELSAELGELVLEPYLGQAEARKANTRHRLSPAGA